MQVLGYMKDGAIRVILDAKLGEVFVPDDMQNRHRQAIAEWEAEGNAIPLFEVPLASIKSQLKATIDAEAEEARLRYITGGAGQAMTYQQKAAEAAACLAEVDPPPENYPLLAYEVGITAETLLGVARLVFEAHQGWRQIGGPIEALRLSGKRGVEAAETVEAAQAAAQIDWP